MSDLLNGLFLVTLSLPVLLLVDFLVKEFMALSPVAETVVAPEATVEAAVEPAPEAAVEPAPEATVEPAVEEPVVAVEEEVTEAEAEVAQVYTIRELKAIASAWNKGNPTAKIKKWDRMSKEVLADALQSVGAL